ncbi:TonB-dependent receptor [Erythrobacter westpacificensis]|uniref:TonB-dependent receptor n=1 Tax=Erythrobacter westpacificensis TaxID=1055231 RepID=A0ABP9KPI2_9SPHN
MSGRSSLASFGQVSAAALALALASEVAYAQEDAGEVEQESGADTQERNTIIVSANRRDERLQDVPIAINVVTADTLGTAGIEDTADLAQVVPGLVYQTSQSGVQAHLRGVGTTALPAGTENSIATYIDGVYILSMSGGLMQLSNIAQVEVLKGPQGTLFGRNATGGVINVRTRDPEYTPGGNVRLGYGNYDTFTASGYVTTGLSDNMAIDVAGYMSLQGDGWGTNVFTGEDVYQSDSYAVRGKLLFEPGDRDEFRLTGDYSRTEGNAFSSYRLLDGTFAQYGPGDTVAAARPSLVNAGAVGANPGQVAPFAVVGDPYAFNGNPYDTATFTQPFGVVESWGASLQWDHEFNNFRFQSITAYRELTADQQWGATPVPAFRTQANFIQNDDQFSQEFQLASLASSDIQWVFGLYYLDGGSNYDPFFITGTAIAPLEQLLFNAFTSTESGAAFGQATIPLGDRTNLTLGGRYTIEERGLVGETIASFLPGFGPPVPITTDQFEGEETFKKFTWRVSLDHRITPNVLGYASWNRGFKSGIYNSVPPGGLTGEAVPPEVLDAYEIGLKTELADGRLNLNIAAFYYDYSDLQVTVFTPIAALIESGPKAEIYGFDLDFIYSPTRLFSINGGLNYSSSEFKEYPNAQFLVPQTEAQGGGNAVVLGSAVGNELPYAPEWTANLGANLEVPLDTGHLDFALNYHYNDGWFAGPDNILEQPSYHLVNGSIGWQIGDTGPNVGLWVRNLLEEEYYTFLSAGNNPGGYNQGIRGAPRTYGITLGYEF